MFETVCNLLYQLDPDDLIHFVEYAHMVREGQQGDASFIKRSLKKVQNHTLTDTCITEKCKMRCSYSLIHTSSFSQGYFYQRAIESISVPNEGSSSSQVQAFCQLCLLR